jgi:hypothetical protein
MRSADTKAGIVGSRPLVRFSLLGVLTSAGIVVGLLARAGGEGEVLALLILSAVIVAIAQQTLP